MGIHMKLTFGLLELLFTLWSLESRHLRQLMSKQLMRKSGKTHINSQIMLQFLIVQRIWLLAFFMELQRQDRIFNRLKNISFFSTQHLSIFILHYLHVHLLNQWSSNIFLMILQLRPLFLNDWSQPLLQGFQENGLTLSKFQTVQMEDD